MHAFPHRYVVSASGASVGDIELTGDRLPVLRSAAPLEFDGPGNRWSPETLLVGAVVDCFVLTFRAVARGAKLPWTSLDCTATGTLDRVDGATQFTDVALAARLTVPAGVDQAQAERALEKAERACLVSKSLKAAIHLECQVDVAEAARLNANARARYLLSEEPA